MDKNKSHILTAILGLCLVALLYFLISRNRQVELDSGYRVVMGTFTRIVIVAPNSTQAEKCIEAGFAEIYLVDELMSDFKSDSEISRINKEGFNQPVQVSQATFEVIQRSIGFSKLTDGAFDITVGPLVDLWRSAGKSGTVPGEKEIAEAKTKVGFEKLILNEQNRTVKFTVEGMRLDLGAIGKGYAVDKAVEATQKAGAIGAMVDIGGNIRCFGKPAGGKKKWLIGLQNPDPNNKAVKSELLPTLQLENKSVATSGDYQQFVVLKGKKYSHIINRRTGTSAEGLSSVTIIADNATDADALSTAVSVMGAEKGFALIEKLPNTEAILITSPPNSELLKTSGADKYIKRK